MPAAVDGLKECCKCGETKPVSEYHKNKTSADGLQYKCRSCEKKRYQSDKEHILKVRKKHYEANKERKLEYRKKHYQANKERILKQQKKYHEANKEKISEYKKEYVQKLPAAVYKVENKTTGKTYIGQSTQYHRRVLNHISDMRLGRHACLQHDYDEHGLDIFEFSIIQEYPCDTSREILFEHEQQLINECLAEGKELYNFHRNC